MRLDQLLSRAHGMDEAAWARHANPWSVYTRMAALPLLALAVWSRAWLGWWALVPIGLVAVWLWINPRMFPPPASTDSWAAKGVLGEQIWLARGATPIPPGHRRAALALSAVAAAGGAVMLWGLVVLAVWPTLFGMAVAFLGKLWFVDRMVWLYEDTARAARG